MIIILSIIIFSIEFIQKCFKLPGYIIAIFLQFIISLFYMTLYISISVDKDIKTRRGIAFMTNMLFPLTTMLLIFKNTYSKEIVFQIINLISLFLMIYCIKKCVKIKAGDDLSYLKEMNHFCVAIFTAFLLFYDYNKECYNNDSIKNFINFYYLLPFLLLKSLYESLERRSKTYKRNKQK